MHSSATRRERDEKRVLVTVNTLSKEAGRGRVEKWIAVNVESEGRLECAADVGVGRAVAAALCAVLWLLVVQSVVALYRASTLLLSNICTRRHESAMVVWYVVPAVGVVVDVRLGREVRVVHRCLLRLHCSRLVSHSLSHRVTAHMWLHVLCTSDLVTRAVISRTRPRALVPFRRLFTLFTAAHGRHVWIGQCILRVLG